MLFSIIIPTFNSEKVLAKALESVLKQTLVDYEILIIDSLSTDDTLAVAQKFQDSRIGIYSEKDEGIYDAMNKGIEKAKGEWLYFLGSDDRLKDSSVLMKISEYIIHKNSQIDFIYGNVLWGNTGRIYDGEFSLVKLLNNTNICHQSIFVRKKISLSLRKFNLQYPQLADYHFNIKVFTNPTIKIGYINEVIAYYSLEGISSKIYFNDFFLQDLAKIKIEFIKNLNKIDKTIYYLKVKSIRKGLIYQTKGFFYKIALNCISFIGYRSKYKLT